MKMTKTYLPAMLCLALLTGCGAGSEFPAATMPETTQTPAASTETTAVTETTTAASTTAASTTAASTTAETAQAATADSGEATGETSWETVRAFGAWQKPYRDVLTEKLADSTQEDSYFALIRLDDNVTPELVVMDSLRMWVYTYLDQEAVLLVEDGYKSSAVSDQNVCFREGQSMLASAFSTMGAGSGFTIYQYDGALDGVHMNLIGFDNNEDEGGEMPYNTIWDKAAEYGVHNGGYHDVTLDDTWTHVGTEYAYIWPLTEEQIAAVMDEPFTDFAQETTEQNTPEE